MNLILVLTTEQMRQPQIVEIIFFSQYRRALNEENENSDDSDVAFRRSRRYRIVSPNTPTKNTVDVASSAISLHTILGNKRAKRLQATPNGVQTSIDTVLSREEMRIQDIQPIDFIDLDSDSEIEDTEAETTKTEATPIHIE